MTSAGCVEVAKEWDGDVLKNDIIELTVVPQIGGRVIQYTLGGYGFFWENSELINTTPPAGGLGPDDAWLNYGGAKLWPAPQGWDNDEQWPGPPDAVLDGGVFKMEVLTDNADTKSIRLTSETNSQSGIQFSRVITVKKGTSRVNLEVTMLNVDDKPRRWGIWDHIQFDASNRHGEGHNENLWGFCPLNSNSKFHRGYSIMYGLVNNPSYKPDYENGMMRVHYQHLVGKAGVDSPDGWVATVDATDGYAFVHRYTYEPDKAYPDDSSVEFWFNGMGEFAAWGKINKMGDKAEDIPYVLESEIISPFADLGPGDKFSFKYQWCSAKIPAGLPVVSCSNVGVTCKPLEAGINDGKLSLSGKFGVFYEGRLRVSVIDGNSKSSLISEDTKVSPLVALELESVITQAPVEDAKVVVIDVIDGKGNKLGNLATAEIK